MSSAAFKAVASPRILARLRSFYVGRLVRHRDQVGTVEDLVELRGLMLGVRFGDRLAVLRIREIELAH